MTSLGHLGLPLGGSLHSVSELDLEDKIKVKVRLGKVFTQMDLGLPKRGIPHICNKNRHVYRGPLSWVNVASKHYNKAKMKPFLSARIQCSSEASLSGEQTAVLYIGVVKAKVYGTTRCNNTNHNFNMERKMSNNTNSFF